jgi:hypothetical protein
VNEPPAIPATETQSDLAARKHASGDAGADTVHSAAQAAESDSGVTLQKGGGSALPVALAGWLVPGAGHFLVGRWTRGLGVFVAVAGLAVTGYVLRGNVFSYHPGDAFGTLGFLADAGSGIFYGMARLFERAGPDVSRAAGDYGTRFIAAAGIVNILAVLDAFEIASRRRA